MIEPGRTVAVVLHEQAVGGASLCFLRILPLLEERGWRFVFWTPGPGSLREQLERSGHSVAGRTRRLRFSWRSLRMPPGPVARLADVPGYLRELHAWIESHRPALVHANTLLTIPELLVARRTTASPTLLYVHEILPDSAKGAAAAAMAGAGADTVIGNSRATVTALRNRGIPARLVYNGVPAPKSTRATRPSEAGLVIGTLGTVSRRKGSDVFLSAARLVRARVPAADLRMIGACVEGPERPWAEAIVEAAQRESVRCGAVPDPFRELLEWDILVLPSRDEPFGLVVAEAMAVGLPVVATRVGGLPELVSDDAGVLVDADDAEALAEAIVRLARDPSLRTRMGAAGRERIAREFTLERQADGVHRAYLDTLAREGGSATAHAARDRGR